MLPKSRIPVALSKLCFWLFAVAYALTLVFAVLIMVRPISNGANVPPAAAVYMAMLFVCVGQLALITLHELGHAAMAAALGWRVSMIVSGPIAIKLRPPRITMGTPVRGLGLAGAAFVVPWARGNSAREFIAVFAAGPLVNIATGLLIFAYSYWAKSPNVLHSPLKMFAVLSLFMGVRNLVPFSLPSKVKSDGANIVEFLRGTDLEARTTILRTIDAIIRGVCPRAWDPALVTALIDKSKTSRTGQESALLYSYYFDCGDMANARASLDHGVSIMGAIDALLINDAFLSAFAENDLARASASLGKVKHKGSRQSVAYFTAEAALRAGEGDMIEAARSIWLARKALRKWPLATDCDWDVLDRIEARMGKSAEADHAPTTSGSTPSMAESAT